ncbi:globin [Arcobacter sp. CECT 8989]|uniref:globin domain-containing protein n=1 Tax=Arcobacter sp. CECT 8989 TaxID=2044509 RepID=UPI00100B5D17|nr:globin [Arcobacter sp. CECT 8989]RXK03916.1 globin [Arcobacter sp. CECT 8989]
MQYNVTPAQIGTRPQVALPNPKILEALGEEGMRKMVSDHYDLLRQSNIRGLFPPTDEGFEMAKKHSADFFIQICGGPRYFDMSRGAPRMVARHMPFAITQEARRIWLESYIMVLNGLDLDEELKQSFWNYIDIFSIWMMNTHDEE